MSEPVTSQIEILADYAGGPARLKSVLAGLPDGGLDVSLHCDSWTIRQIVHHVADGDDIWKAFIKRAIGNPEAQFSLEWYLQLPQDEWAQRWAYRDRAIEPSLALLRANRAHIVQLLECIPTAWEQSLPVRRVNGETRTMSVAWVVEMQARHVIEHVQDICNIREVHGI